MHFKGPELVKLSTVYNGPPPSLAINDIDSNPFAFMSTISHEVWGYVYFTRGGVPVITSTFELKEGESVNLKTGEILSKEETKKLMDKKKNTKDLYQEDNRHDWIVSICVPSGPTFKTRHEVYHSLTRKQLIELLCHRAIKQDSYLSTGENSEYKHNDFISEKIRNKQIIDIEFYKIADCEYGMQNEIYKQLPIIKEKEVQAEKEAKEQAERRERLKLYQELKKEFEGKE